MPGLSGWKRHADYSTPGFLLTSLQMLQLSTSVKYVKGVGPKLAELLAGKGIQSLDDLLHYLPFRYEDRLNRRVLPNCARVKWLPLVRRLPGLRVSSAPVACPFFQMTAGQGRTRLKCIWFNATYLKDKFKPGQIVALGGKSRAGLPRRRTSTRSTSIS